LNTKQRWLAIAALGLVALVLAVKAPTPQKETVPVRKGSVSANQAVASKTANQNTNSKNNRVANTEELTLDTLQPRHMAQLDKDDLFQSKSWYVPPPPPPKPKYVAPPPPPPPPPPTAPPLPFSFMGSYQEPGDKLVVYLARADKLYAVSPGDTLEGIYKIEGVNAGQLSIMYLPLNIRQNLRIGDR